MSLYIAAFIFPLILTSLPVPATEKHPHSLMLPPHCCTVRMLLARWWVVPGFLQIWRLPFRPKSSNFLMVGESFRCLLANSRWAIMCLLLSLLSGSLPYRPDWWSAVKMVVLLKGFPLSTENHWNSVRVAIGFLVTSLTKTLLPRSLSLARWPVLGRVLLVANFFLIQKMEATVLILGLRCCRSFSLPFPRSVSRYNPASEV